MRKNQRIGTCILSFLLALFLVFGQGGQFVFAEGEEEAGSEGVVQEEVDPEQEEIVIEEGEEGEDDKISENNPIEGSDEIELTKGSFQSGEWVRITSDGQAIDSITVNGKTVSAIYVTLATRNKINVGTDATYSCAAFVKRFYNQVYGVNVYNLSGPSYTPLSSNGGGFVQVSSPQVGDIVRDNEGTHWAIVKSVQSDGKVIIIQQNRHWEKGDGYTYGDKNGAVGSRSVAYFRYNGNGGTPAYTVTNTGVTSITETTARINAEVTPTATGVTEVGFELGTSANSLTIKNFEGSSGTTKAIWYDLGTGKWTGALKKGTTYYYRIYIIANGTKYYSNIDSFKTAGDATAPSITNARVIDLSPSGYTVACEVTDNIGVSYVTFPTWTEKNNQDDLNPDWNNKCRATSVVGNTYYYQVKISDHNNETGKYITHIYAYDAAGNTRFSDVSAVIPVYVSGITISPQSAEVIVGKTVALSATVAPTNATNKALSWSSSDTGVATVDQKGVVTGVKKGTATITAKAQDAGGKSASVKITVKDETIAVTGVTIDKTSVTMEIGKTETLTATVAPGNATNKGVSWSSSKENVATVDSKGVVTAKSAGTSIITVVTADGGYKASCTVNVKPDAADYARIAVASVSGTAGSKVEVPVSISNNPGIAAVGLIINYDKTALSLSEIKAGKVFSAGTFDAKTSSGIVQWYYAGEDDVIKTNGEIFTAVFTVNDGTAKGNYDVSVGLLSDDNANFTDHNGTAVPVSFEAGRVSVGAGIQGDLTGDGTVAMGDVVKLARAVAGYITLTAEEEALADVTGDGKVAMGDVVRIARYVAGYIDSFTVATGMKMDTYSMNSETPVICDGEDMAILAGNGAELVVAEKKAKAGDSVEIPVEIKTNPGIASAAFTVSYDTANLELKAITKGDVFSNGTFTSDTDKNLVQWYDVSTNKDTTTTGTAFTLSFAVKSAASAGRYAVKVTYLDNEVANVTNINSENVPVDFTDGAIAVESEGGNEEPVPAGIAEVTIGKGKAEAGNTVEIPVEIKTNPGIASAALSVSYNTAVLELKSITKGEVFANGTFTADVDKNLIQWYDVSTNKDTTATGTLFTLGFAVKENAEAGKYEVNLGCLDGQDANVTNINSETVNVEFTKGEIEVEEAKAEPVPAGTAQIEVGKALVNPGKIVEIPVRITTNPGIAGLSLSVSYNKAALTLKSVNKGKVFTAGTFTGDADKDLIQWYDISNNKNTTDTGVMFTLGFEANADAAAGKYAVSVDLQNGEASNATNIDSENVPVTFIAGEIEIASGTITPPEQETENEDPFCVAPAITDETIELYLVKGQKFTMPETGWVSNSKKQVAVSKKGVVKAMKVTTEPVILTKGDQSIKVYVTEPKIDKKLTISDGKEHKINLTYDMDHLDVYWISSDPKVAQVDEKGVVEPVAAGSATITAYINSKAYKSKVKVVETEPFLYRDVYLTVGASKTIKIKGIKNPVWESDDTSVVTVKKNKITAVTVGTATLTTTYEGETYRVNVYVEDIALDMRDVVQKGKYKYTLSLEVGDERAVYFMDVRHDVVFTSNKSEVAYVDQDGYLIARKAGKAKLTAKVNGKTVTLKVTVN